MKVYARDLVVDGRHASPVGSPVITDPEGLGCLIAKLRELLLDSPRVVWSG